jgi:hypothetical protein
MVLSFFGWDPPLQIFGPVEHHLDLWRRSRCGSFSRRDDSDEAAVGQDVTVAACSGRITRHSDGAALMNKYR